MRDQNRTELLQPENLSNGKPRFRLQKHAHGELREIKVRCGLGYTYRGRVGRHENGGFRTNTNGPCLHAPKQALDLRNLRQQREEVSIKRVLVLSKPEATEPSVFARNLNFACLYAKNSCAILKLISPLR